MQQNITGTCTLSSDSGSGKVRLLPAAISVPGMV